MSLFEAWVQTLISLFCISLDGLFCGVAHIHKYLSSFCLAINQRRGRLLFLQQLHWLDANHPSFSFTCCFAAGRGTTFLLSPIESCYVTSTCFCLFHLMTEYSFSVSQPPCPSDLNEERCGSKHPSRLTGKSSARTD